MTNETPPSIDPHTTLTLLERGRDLTIVIPAVSFLLAVDLALTVSHGFNLTQLTWPLPPGIKLGGVLSFFGCYLVLIALVLPALVVLLDQFLYAADEVLSRIGISLLHATTVPRLRDHVNVHELDRWAKANKCDFTQRLVDAKLRELKADTQEIGKLAQSAGACAILFVADWLMHGSSLSSLQAQCGWLGIPLILFILTLLCLPWLGEMRALEKLSTTIYFPLKAQDEAQGSSDKPAYRAGIRISPRD